MLNLSSNKIDTLEDFPSIDLEELNLENNVNLIKAQVEVLKNKHKSMKIYF